jgi:hypothetical protein
MTLSISVDLAQRIIDAARIAVAMHLEADESSFDPSIGGADVDAGPDRSVRQDLEPVGAAN